MLLGHVTEAVTGGGTKCHGGAAAGPMAPEDEPLPYSIDMEDGDTSTTEREPRVVCCAQVLTPGIRPYARCHAVTERAQRVTFACHIRFRCVGW